MISFVSLSIFIGFYVLYNTSKKASLSNHFLIETWIQQNSKAAKYIGFSILILAYSCLSTSKSFGVTSLVFVIQLMTIGGLVVLLTPLKIINYKFIIGLFFLAFFFEYYL